MSRTLRKRKEVLSSSRSTIRGSQDISGILPNVCIFCNADKYLPKQSTREKLLSCCQLRADATIRKAAEAITADNIVAKEESYHPSYYRNYTKVCYRDESKGSKGTEIEVHSDLDEAFQGVKHFLVAAIYEKSYLRKHSKIVTFNLKWKIKDAFPEINFTSLDNNHLLCFPNTLSTEMKVVNIT